MSDIKHKLGRIKQLIVEIEQELGGVKKEPRKYRVYQNTQELPYHMVTPLVNAVVKAEELNIMLTGTQLSNIFKSAGIDMEDYVGYIKNLGGTDAVKAGKIMLALSKLDLKGYNIRVKPRDGKNYYVLREN